MGSESMTAGDAGRESGLAGKRRVFFEALETLGELKESKPIHDVRVASRRLRAALRLVASSSEDRAKPWKKAVQQVRRVAKALAPIRDADVSLELVGELQRELETNGEADLRGIEALRGWIEKTREEAREQGSRVLTGGRIRKLKERLDGLEVDKEAELADTEAQVLAERLKERADAVRAKLPLVELERPPADKLHRLRIAGKKLRYTLELSGEDDHASILKQLKALQDLLGAHHDWTVLHQVVTRHRKKLEDAGRKARLRTALEMLLVPISRRLVSIEQELRGAALPIQRWLEQTHGGERKQAHHAEPGDSQNVASAGGQSSEQAHGGEPQNDGKGGAEEKAQAKAGGDPETGRKAEAEDARTASEGPARPEPANPSQALAGEGTAESGAATGSRGESAGTSSASAAPDCATGAPAATRQGGATRSRAPRPRTSTTARKTGSSPASRAAEGEETAGAAGGETDGGTAARAEGANESSGGV